MEYLPYFRMSVSTAGLEYGRWHLLLLRRVAFAWAKPGCIVRASTTKQCSGGTNKVTPNWAGWHPLSSNYSGGTKRASDIRGLDCASPLS